MKSRATVKKTINPITNMLNATLFAILTEGLSYFSLYINFLYNFFYYSCCYRYEAADIFEYLNNILINMRLILISYVCI